MTLVGLKKLSDVAVGSLVKIGGAIYKVDTNTGRQVLFVKQMFPGAFEQQKRGAGTLINDYEGSEYHLVNVIEDSSSAKQDLTSQLRQQVKQNSLTDSFRSQVAAYEEEVEDEDDWDDIDEEDDGLDYSPCSSGWGYAAAPIQSFGVSGVEEAKQSALTANLRSQANQQSLFNAHVKINDISKGIAGLSNDIAHEFEGVGAVLADHRDGIVSMQEDVQNLAFAVDQASRDADYAGEFAYQTAQRVTKLEQKQLEEEKKVELQNILNAKLAEAKKQSDLQAQLNQKLNQKSGGNGTMKNVLGAFKNQFGKVEGKFAFSLVTGGLAIRKGISNDFVAYDANGTITDVSGLTLDFKVPAFKLPVAASEVAVGDIVLNGADFGYVTKVNDGYVETIVPEKNAKGTVLPTNNVLFGNAFYTVVKTIDAAGKGGFNPMLLLAMGDGNKDELVKIMALSGGLGGAGNGTIDPTMLMLLGDNMDELLPFFLMQQGGVAAQGFNPLMLLALSDKKGGKKDNLLPLLMMQGQQGAGAINPMMMLALGDGDIDLTTLALMGGFGGNGLFGATPKAPVAPATQDGNE